MISRIDCKYLDLEYSMTFIIGMKIYRKYESSLKQVIEFVLYQHT